MADTKNSASPEMAGPPDGPRSREILTRPISELLRFADIRLSDHDAIGTHAEFLNLLLEHGFDLEIEYVAEGRLSVTVERGEQGAAPNDLRDAATISTIMTAEGALISPGRSGVIDA